MTVAASLPQDSTSCVIASFLSGRSCRDVYLALQSPEPITGSNGTSRSVAEIIAKARRRGNERASLVLKEQQVALAQMHPFVESSETAKDGKENEDGYTEEELAMRVPKTVLPWVPCYHPGRSCDSFTGKEGPGPYGDGAWCSCKRSGTWCEPGCGCPLDCTERIKGCDCHRLGKECKVPTEDAKGRSQPGCKCIEYNRECHPELCHGHLEKGCKSMIVQTDKAVVSDNSMRKLRDKG